MVLYLSEKVGMCMKISTKGRYALRLMLDVALHSHGAAVPLRDVAQRQEISDKYLEQIVTRSPGPAGSLGPGRGGRLPPHP